MCDFIILSVSVIKIFYYNHLIKKEDSGGSYDFMDDGEQKKLLSGAGFQVIGETKLTYANQAYLDVGIKKS